MMLRASKSFSGGITPPSVSKLCCKSSLYVVHEILASSDSKPFVWMQLEELMCGKMNAERKAHYPTFLGVVPNIVSDIAKPAVEFQYMKDFISQR